MEDIIDPNCFPTVTYIYSTYVIICLCSEYRESKTKVISLQFPVQVRMKDV